MKFRIAILLELLVGKYTYSRILFFLFKKNINFVRLLIHAVDFLLGFVFALFYVHFGKRKPAAGYFKLHRLLYFTRAVGLPTPAVSRRVGVGKGLHNPCIRLIIW